MAQKPLNYRREMLVALAVFVVSLFWVCLFALVLLSTLDRKPGSYRLSELLIWPSVLCLCITGGVAFGIARFWRVNPFLLGLIAAVPYFAMSGSLLLESRFGATAFWTAAALITILFYVGAVYLHRSKHSDPD